MTINSRQEHNKVVEKILELLEQKNDNIKNQVLNILEEILVKDTGYFYLIQDQFGNPVFPRDKENMQMIRNIIGTDQVDLNIYEYDDEYYGFHEYKLLYGDKTYKIITLKNISQNIKKEETLRQCFEEKEKKLMSDDRNSKLWNSKGTYKHFTKYLRNILGRNHTFACLYLDVDNFKQVNDNYGHEAGNEVLKQIGNTIKDNIRAENDIVGRIGGDEFLIILKDISEEEVKEKSNKLLHAFNNFTVDFCDKIITDVTVSIGVYFVDASEFKNFNSDDAESIAQSIKTAADKTMYESKESGKNKVSFSSNINKFNKR